MLDAMLECSRHLPVLSIVITWTPPASWARLRCVGRGFFKVLDRSQLLAFVAIQRGGIKNKSVHEILDTELEGCDLISVHNDVNPAGVSELSICEMIFVELLRGTEINVAQRVTGLTPLMRAAEEGALRLGQLLLAHSADCNRVSIGKSTALSLVIGTSCCECVLNEPTWPAPICICPRPAFARMLLERTTTGMQESFIIAVRRSMQDLAYMPVAEAFIELGRISINEEIMGSDGQIGSALSLALEPRIVPLELPLLWQSQMVARIVELRADVQRPGPYTSWLGGPPCDTIIEFAIANGSDQTIVRILSGEDDPYFKSTPPALLST